MSLSLSACSPLLRLLRSRFRRRTRAGLGLLAIAILIAGCSRTTPTLPLAGPDASDPDAPVAPASYESSLGDYTSRQPVTPQPWRQQNARVAPGGKP